MFEQFTQKNKGGTAVASRKKKSSKPEEPQEKTHFLKESAPELKSPMTKQQITLEKIKNFKVEGGPNRKDILNFTKQLAIMIKAGISLQDSLESISENITKDKLQQVIDTLWEIL